VSTGIELSTRDKVLEIFDRVREDNVLPWKGENFLEYLIRPNGTSIDNSFKGKRYKNAFLDAVQLEFAICFPSAFFEKRWNFDAFVTYVGSRYLKIDVNFKMAERRLREDNWAHLPALLLINLIIVPACLWLPWPYLWIALVLPVALNGVVLWLQTKVMRFNRELLARISEVKSKAQ
jgi:hypothetical protein